MTAPIFTPPPLPTADDSPKGPTASAPWAGSRSQVAVFAVAAAALAIGGAAVDHLDWGVAAMAVLGLGVALGIGAGLHRFFRNLPGTVAGLFAGMGLVVLSLFAWSGDAARAPWAVVPLVWVLLVGMDWCLVTRLRSLPFVFGLLVVLGVMSDQSWAFAAALGWLALAMAALASLEADRRAAQPAAAAMGQGRAAPDAGPRDLITTVLLALAVAVGAALVLSTPSCRIPGSGDRFGDLDQELGSGLGGGELDPGSSGTTPGPARLPDQYVPDASGRFLIPNDGAGGTSDPTEIPTPERFPLQDGGPSSFTVTDPDGTITRYERDEDGTLRATVEDPDRPRQTYEYHEAPDGLTRIDELDEDGNVRATYFYDPQGQVAADAQGPSDDPEPPTTAPSGDQADQADQADDGSLHVDPWLLAAIAVAVLAIAGLIVSLRRRWPGTGEPSGARPWALQLARQLELEGRRRGRARGRSETLADYAAALEVDALPDHRLSRVGAVIGAGLYAAHEPEPTEQRWASGTLTEIAAAHPAPGRAERRRSEAGSTRS